MNRARLLLSVSDYLYLVFLADRAFGKGGYDVATAFTAEDALTRMNRERFDVLIVELSGLNTRAMADLRRAKELNPRTIVLLLSGNGGSFLVVETPQDLRAYRVRTLEEVVSEHSLRPMQ